MRNRFALRGTGRGVSTIGFRRRPASTLAHVEFFLLSLVKFVSPVSVATRSAPPERAQQARFARGTDLRDVKNYCAGGSFTGMARTGGPGFLLSSGSNKYRSGSSST